MLKVTAQSILDPSDNVSEPPNLGRGVAKIDTRAVPKAMEEFQIMILHGTLPNGTPTFNSLIQDGVTWRTKIAIALSLKPTLSCSSHSLSGKSENLWSWVGLVVSNGQIEAAWSKDAGTKANSLKHRRIPQYLKRQEIEDCIQEALVGRREEYNELVIAEPRFGGLYFSIDQFAEADSSARKLCTLEDVRKLANELSLPLFLISEGKVSLDFSPKERKAISNTEGLFDSIKTLSDEQEKALLLKVLEENPFKIMSDDRNFFRASHLGRSLYIQVAGRNNNCGTLSGSPLEVYIDEKLKNARLLLRVPDMDRRGFSEFLDVDGQLYCRLDRRGIAPQFDGQREEIEHPHQVDFSVMRPEYIMLSVGGIDLGPKGKDTMDLVSQVQDQMLEQKRKLENYTEPSKQSSRELNFKALQELAFILHGFADEANTHGETATAKYARFIANDVISEMCYRELLHQRTLPSGAYKMLRDDLVILE